MVDVVVDDRWRALWQLCLLSAAMFLGAFSAGVLPLYASLSQRRLNAFNCFGAGMLAGTALAVIVPEGIHQLYDDGNEAAGAHGHSLGHGHRDRDGNAHASSWLAKETVVGLALVSGFLTMLFVEHLGCGDGHAHGHGHAHGPVSLSDLGLTRSNGSKARSSEADPDDHVDDPDAAERQGMIVRGGVGANSTTTKNTTSAGQPKPKQRSTVTVGLLVHAAADGVALGAAKAASSHEWKQVELVVFFAIMMHKVPAALALALYLRHSGLDHAGIRRSVACFALAAPAGALAVFLLLHPGFAGLGAVSDITVAFGLLYSGGTFLYVSLVHTLQELPRDAHGRLTRKQLLLVTLGCAVPLLLSLAHDHGDAHGHDDDG